MSLHNSHLRATRTPHENGTTVKAVCGEAVDRAVAVALLEGELIVSFPRGVCPDCIKALGQNRRHLLYQITSAALWKKNMKAGVCE